MKPNSFTDKDKEKIISFLNMIAEKGEFKFKVEDSIKFYGLLSYFQTELLKKVDSHILEVKNYIEPKLEVKPITKKK